VTTSFRTLRTFAALAVVAGFLATGGCANDLLTNSKQAKRQGMRELKEGNYTDAAGSFRNATNQNPRDYESYYYLGVAYDKMGSYQQSIRALRNSLASMEFTLAGRENTAFRADVLDALARAIAKSSDRQAQVEKLEQDNKGKETAENYLLIGKVYRYSGDHDSALDAYKRAHLLDPRNFQVAKEYGLYLEQIGQVDAAQPVLVKAYQLNDKDTDVSTALARLGVVAGPSLRQDNAPRSHPTREEMPRIDAPGGGSGAPAGSTGPRD
jgi:tetratricopeptide (TPR) repeat protein